ncbi:MAG TPA: potassium transporter TrkA [Vicinamibacteria bacterium]|jgi:voltage-gated potassium channel Kch
MSSDSRPTTISASLRERLHYAFDRSISRGPMALIAWLAVVSGLLVAAISFLVWLLALAPAGDAGARPGFLEIAWASLMRTLDPGTMGADRGSWPFLFSMLAMTLGGIFVISTLIGVLTTGINERLDELRKGRSKVIESGHTVILGWSPQVFTIVSELVEASRNQKRSCVVVLGPEDKVEMEDRLRERVADWGRTRVVCRRGDPTDVTDLEIAGIHAARSIIVLAPPGEAPDSAVIKTLLAITNHPNRRAEPYHVVAEIHDPRNLEVARMVGKAEVELVLVPDLLSRITVQTCRQSGLSVAYLELLDFGGDELYFHEEPGLVGKTFGEALLAYEDSSVIGLRPREGGTLVNPKMDRRIEAGDKVIAISEDDDTVRLSGLKNLRLNQNAIQKLEPAARTPERTLVLGWNERVPMIVRELDQYVAAGSAVHVVAAREEGDAALQAEVGVLQNQTLAFTAAEPTHRGALDALDVPSYHHVILLTNEGLPEQEADARTLITLLHLREIAETASRPFSIVSEMLDPRNRVLAEVARADDFIVGNRLVALLLAQVSENKELNAVFQDLFDPEGSEIYLKLASNYVTIGKPVNFYTVVESARRRGEIAIGYRIKAQSGDASQAYGVKVNPKKSKSVTFAEWDRIIVIAED